MMLMFVTVMLSAQTNLQNADLATTKGTYMVGLKSTNVGFSTTKDTGVNIDVSLEAGYFFAPRTAFVFGAGYDTYIQTKEAANLGYDSMNAWTYMAGLKHYLGSVVPVQVDYNGSTGNGINMNAIGVQAGYAFFPSSKFSIEPALRYNIGLAENDVNVFSGAIGFNYLF